jgi:hypothetical protein
MSSQKHITTEAFVLLLCLAPICAYYGLMQTEADPGPNEVFRNIFLVYAFALLCRFVFWLAALNANGPHTRRPKGRRPHRRVAGATVDSASAGTETAAGTTAGNSMVRQGIMGDG